MTLIRITKAASSTVTVQIAPRPPVHIPVGPIFDLDSVPGYSAEELRGVLDDSLNEYETVGGEPQAQAGDVGGENTSPADPDDRLAAEVAQDDAQRDPLDHDGDGRKGGSVSGENATAAKGRRRRNQSPKGGK